MNEKNWISLPGGMIINLANVAYFAEADKPGRVEVVFIATFSVDNPQPLHIALTAEDSKALLTALFASGIKTEHLRQKTGIKPDSAINLDVLSQKRKSVPSE